jgi:hypothetical protein
MKFNDTTMTRKLRAIAILDGFSTVDMTSQMALER